MAPRPLTRTIAALAAVVLVGCGVMVAWHRATVMHGVCAEHGDELHLAQATEEHADHGDGRHLEDAPWELIDGDHHCQLAATTRAVTTGGVAVDAASIDSFELVPALPAATVTTAALYRLAPKTSPPV